MGAAITPARTCCGEISELFSQRLVFWGQWRLVALGGAVLAGDPARPTLGEAEPILQHADGLAPPGRA